MLYQAYIFNIIHREKDQSPVVETDDTLGHQSKNREYHESSSCSLLFKEKSERT